MGVTFVGVTLAQFDGQIWVVGGEEHIDDLLIDRLPPDVPVDLVVCENRAAVYALWHERSSEPTDGGQPWMLNPVITRRILGGLGLAAGVVRFAPWSARLEDSVAQTMAGTVAWLAAHPGGTVVLRQFTAARPEPGYADLQRLRGQLALGALIEAGAEPGRVSEDRGNAGAGTDVEELHIVTRPADPVS